MFKHFYYLTLCTDDDYTKIRFSCTYFKKEIYSTLNQSKIIFYSQIKIKNLKGYVVFQCVFKTNFQSRMSRNLNVKNKFQRQSERLGVAIVPIDYISRIVCQDVNIKMLWKLVDSLLSFPKSINITEIRFKKVTFSYKTEEGFLSTVKWCT